MLTRFDPRAKLALILALATVSGFSLQPSVLVVTSALLVALQPMARVQFRDWLRLLPVIAMFAAVTLVLNLLFHPASDPTTIKVLHVELNRESAIIGALYCWRFLLLITVALVFAKTVSREEFAELIWRFLEPLAKLGLPVRSFALALSLAVRFIPTIGHEYERISLAQKLRGARFDGNPIQRARRFIPVLMPVVLSSFRRSEILADALTVRGWNAHRSRTFYRRYQLLWFDWLLILLALALVAAWIGLRS